MGQLEAQILAHEEEVIAGACKDLKLIAIVKGVHD